MSETRFIRSTVVKAVRYLGKGNIEGGQPPAWLWDAFVDGTAASTDGGDPLRLSSNGDRLDDSCTYYHVNAGDWIVREPDGRMHSVSADEFAANYNLVARLAAAERAAR